ncbi:chromosomal replication initiator protein DnaA [Akkermansiaceae bacterium]|nr:chromosomal replication initiator protein DnaA [Akkermansiaceae bacterium]
MKNEQDGGQHDNNSNEKNDGGAMGSASEIWGKVKGKMREYLSDDAFTRWFKNAELVVDDERGPAVIGVKSDMQQIWIETNYLDEVRAAFAEGAGIHAQPIIIVVGDAVPQPTKQVARGSVSESDQVRVVKAGEDAPKTVALERKLKRMGINPEFDFASFVVGDNSQFAHAACSAVASGEGRSFNPLFIHGRAGLGKTHLMSAIAQQLLISDPKAKVVFLTAEQFANEFIEAVRKGNLDAFRKSYRTADIMLIDDIQFIAGKERTQDEFFHTFSGLLNTQTQLVLTCDRPALEIQQLEPRLISRFESGLTVELQPPGFETRVAILKRKMDQWNVDLKDEVIFHIANLIQSNVRRLEGALTRVASFSFLSSEVMTIAKVDDLLRDLVRDENSRQITVDSIQKVVCDQYDLSLADMSSRRRPASIAFPRQIAMALSRQLTSLSLVEIGEAFGKRDHGTVIHACKRVEQEIEVNTEVKAIVEKLIAVLQR